MVTWTVGACLPLGVGVGSGLIVLYLVGIFSCGNLDCYFCQCESLHLVYFSFNVEFYVSEIILL